MQMLARKDARRDGLQEGREEGREEGLKEGIEKGLQEGRQEGLLEGRLESYAMLIQKGVLSVADAVKWSGLSEAELEGWIQQHQLQGV